ncbi:hypothetical protein FB451DRAFT_1284490 [Mycena latifolia]|nr:hypothetical protein FB451DRAFT_1284490 [Mycena latifolia]
MAQSDITAYLKDWNAPTFNGNVSEDVQLWLSNIRFGLKQRRVPREHWVDITFRFLGEEPRAVLEGVRQTTVELKAKEGETNWTWDWDTFTRTLIHIHEQAKKDASENDSTSLGEDVRRFRKEHPYAAAAAGLGLIAAGGIAVGPAMLVGTLHLLGLTVSGVFGGSILVAPVAVQTIGASVMAAGAWLGFGNKVPKMDDVLSVAPPAMEDETNASGAAPAETVGADPGVKIDRGEEETSAAPPPVKDGTTTSGAAPAESAAAGPGGEVDRGGDAPPAAPPSMEDENPSGAARPETAAADAGVEVGREGDVSFTEPPVDDETNTSSAAPAETVADNPSVEVGRAGDVVSAAPLPMEDEDNTSGAAPPAPRETVAATAGIEVERGGDISSAAPPVDDETNTSGVDPSAEPGIEVERSADDTSAYVLPPVDVHPTEIWLDGLTPISS